MKMIKASIFLLITIFAASCSGGESSSNGGSRSAGGPPGGNWGGMEQQQKALSVRAFNVTRRPISSYIVANTTFESIREVGVYSKLNAIISKLNVEEGDTVRQGQELAHLDEREIRNEYDQARIAVDQTKVTLQQAEVRAELSQAEYQRAISLFEQKLTSAQEYEQAELTSRTDKLAFDNAQQQLQAAEARLEAAAIQLEYTSIMSPIDGVLTSRLIDIGDRVNVNEQLFSIQEFPPLWARIYVPEKSLPQLHVGQNSRIQVETYPDREFQGRIKLISPTIDSASGTVKVTIEVNRPGSLLRPGMFGTVYIATETHENAVVIPKKAVIRERDLNFVFTIQEDGSVARREIQTGFTEDDWVEIVAGLDSGEKLVTVGHETLSDGYPVLVQAWEGSSAPADFQQASASSKSVETTGERTEQQVASRQAGGGPAAGGQWGPGSGGGPGRGNPEQFFERLLQNPDVKKRWDAKVKEDPEAANDPEKKRAFIREIMSEMRGNSAR